MNKKNEAISLLNQIGFENEKGWSNNGFYTSTEVANMMDKYGVTQALMPTLKLLVEHGSPAGMGHEAIHCFDVADGSAELVKILDESGVSPDVYFPHDTETAFLAGVFHDIVLGLKRESLETAIPREALETLVTPEHAITFGNVVYLKGPIEDDLFGAAMLDVCDLGDNKELQKAVISAAKGKQIVVPTTSSTLLQKVLDGIWYHDGNYPIRGFAEAEMIIGQRLPLYREGLVDDAVMEQGLRKILGYVEIESDWCERSQKTDIAYLKKYLAKKAPGFLDAIKGTKAYDFVIEDLVPRQRSLRTLDSPAFAIGVDESKKLVESLQKNKELMSKHRELVEELLHKYDNVNAKGRSNTIYCSKGVNEYTMSHWKR